MYTMYRKNAMKSLLIAGTFGLTGLLTSCGGGGAGGEESTNPSPTYSISLRADAGSLPLNIAGEWPHIGGRYTTTLYVDVKDNKGRPIPGKEENISCSFLSGMNSGAFFYLDGDPAHETTKTINEVEVTTQNAYRAVSLSTNAGLATFHFHASDVVGAATIRCTVADPGEIVRHADVTIQVGSNLSSGKVSQVVIGDFNTNYLFVQGYNSLTQAQLRVDLVDEAGQPITNISAGTNNLQLRIVPNPASLADDDATLRGLNANDQAVSGASIHVRSVNGQAQFTLVSGTNSGTIQIEATTDRTDNDVGNGVTEAIYNYIALSVLTQAPTQTPTLIPLSISTTTLPAAVGGIAYGTLLEASGGSAPYTWKLVTLGGLPEGLSLDPTGIISGKPSGAANATFNFVVELKDAQGVTLQKTLSIAYAIPTAIPSQVAPKINLSSLSDATELTPYGTVVTASGGDIPYSWVASGLPSGLSMTEAGVISGTPADGTGNKTYPIGLTVTSKAGVVSSMMVNLVVQAKLGGSNDASGTMKLSDRTMSEGTSVSLSDVGGTPPYRLSSIAPFRIKSQNGFTINIAAGCIELPQDSQILTVFDSLDNFIRATWTINGNPTGCIEL